MKVKFLAAFAAISLLDLLRESFFNMSFQQFEIAHLPFTQEVY